ncbi:MAG: hypothetical protein IJL17_22715 [Kiritimatiellae bacterium]|nr:hypothetical protein [Kiritimatiellia bacterium]
MKKVAIVGVEGSGKTVMLAVLGALYSQPDENGLYLEPQDSGTLSYVRRVCGRLQGGQWPSATETDCAFGLKWLLRRQSPKSRRSKVVCEVSCLDFAGEVYRAAFSDGSKMGVASQVEELKDYLRKADTIILLLNLRDSVTRGTGDQRAVDAEYSALKMLKFVLEPEDGAQRLPRVLLALSQADAYSSTIEACGGPGETLRKYLSLVASSFGYLDVMAVNSCGTTIDDNGKNVPDRNLSLAGLKPMVDWMLHAPTDWRNGWRSCVGCGKGALQAISSVNWRGLCTSPVTFTVLVALVAGAIIVGLTVLTFKLEGTLQHCVAYGALIAMYCGGMNHLNNEEPKEKKSAKWIMWMAAVIVLIAPLWVTLLSHFIAWVFL